jgi:protein phosphatase
VTVFRGLDTSLLGMDLNRVADVTDLPVADLTPAGASKVERGIRAYDAAHAERIVSMLWDERLEPCPTEEDLEPSPALPTAAPPASPSAAPDAGAVPTDGTPTSAAPTTSEPSTSAPTSQRATATLEPGVDCREAP